MGQRSQFSLEDSRGREWFGEHRPELFDLRGLLLALVELEPETAEEPEAWRGVLSSPASFVRKLGDRTAHIHITGGPIPDVVVKLILPRTGSRLRRLAEQLRHSRSQRAYLWGHRLRALGIESPRPLGFLERSVQPGLWPSFHVSEYIFAPTLVEFRDKELANMDGGTEAVMRKRLVSRQVADLLRSLHSHGLHHADLHGGNILLTEQGALPIDLESMRTLSIKRRAILRNLVRLNRDFLDTGRVSRADRMRFLREYLRSSPAPDKERRRLFREVAAFTERKLDERGESFVLPRLDKLAGESPPALEKQA